MKQVIIISAIVAMLAGCSSTFDLTLMRADSGATYQGQLAGKGDGTGSAAVTVDGVTYSGPVVRTKTSQTSSVGAVIVPGLSPSMMTMSTNSGQGTTAFGLLTAPGGKGMRCEFTGTNSGGRGRCLDDGGQTFDVLMSRRR